MRHPRPHRSRLCILPVLLLLTLAACEGDTRGTVVRDIPFRADGYLEFLRADSTIIERIAIEIAETDSARARGLMDRRSLPARGGMLFLFPDEADRSFWMKNTPMPLDILFIRTDGTIVNIARRTRPYTEDRINSTGPARYVLELRAGFTDLHHLDEAALIRWRRTKS